MKTRLIKPAKTISEMFDRGQFSFRTWDHVRYMSFDDAVKYIEDNALWYGDHVTENMIVEWSCENSIIARNLTQKEFTRIILKETAGRVSPPVITCAYNTLRNLQ